MGVPAGFESCGGKLNMSVVRSLLLVCAVLTAALAQEFRASITGIVTDPSGAPVGGAGVVVTSVERNTTTTTATNAAGVYTVSFLLPGKYNLTVEKAGFKKFVREGISLGSADKLGLDVSLELGAVAESITVTGEVSLLQTESSSRTATIENRAIENIPTNGRNLYQLQYTLPGVVKASTYWGSMELYAFGNVNGVIIGGGRQGDGELHAHAPPSSLDAGPGPVGSRILDAPKDTFPGHPSFY